MPVRVLDERSIYDAISKRKTYIVDNASTLSMKALRKLLEEDLKVPVDTLKSFKHEIEDRALKIVQSGGKDQQSEDEVDSDEENRPQAKARSKEKPSKHDRKPKEDDKKHRKKAKHEEPRSKAKPAASKPREDKPKKKPKASPPAKNAGAKEHSKEVRGLQAICKRATITIGPSIYKGGDDDEIAERLRALLDKHGLSRQSGEREIAKIKAQLQATRDLDGIDTSNIVEGGRRSRRAAAPAVDYAAIMAHSSSSSDSDADSAAGSDDDSDPGSGSGKRDSKAHADTKDRPQSASKKRRLIDESSSESEGYQADDQDEEEPQQAFGADDAGLEAESPRAEGEQAPGHITPAKRKRATVLEESEAEEEQEPDAEGHAAAAAAEVTGLASRESDDPAREADAARSDVETDQKQPSKHLQAQGSPAGNSTADAATDANVDLQQHVASADSEEDVARQSKPKRRTILDEDSDDED